MFGFAEAAQHPTRSTARTTHAPNKEEPNGRDQDDQWQHAGEEAHPDAGACFVGVVDIAFVQLFDVNAGLADLKENPVGPSVWGFAQSAGSRADIGNQPVVFHRNRAFEATRLDGCCGQEVWNDGLAQRIPLHQSTIVKHLPQFVDLDALGGEDGGHLDGFAFQGLAIATKDGIFLVPQPTCFVSVGHLTVGSDECPFGVRRGDGHLLVVAFDVGQECLPALDLNAATGLVGDGEHDGHDGKGQKPSQKTASAGWWLRLFVVVLVGRRWLLGHSGASGSRRKRRSPTIGGNLALHRTITSPTAVHPRQFGRYAGTIVAVRRFLVLRLGQRPPHPGRNPPRFGHSAAISARYRWPNPPTPR